MRQGARKRVPCVFDKLQLKQQSPILVVDAPESFEREFEFLPSAVSVARRWSEKKTFDFVVVFAQTQKQLNAAAKKVSTKTEGDAVLWVAYPKKTSKLYTGEFDRDHGWEGFGEAGFEPVRVVAVDADWSALRLRRTEFIKTLTRDPSRALSKAAKNRTGKRARNEAQTQAWK